VEVNKFRHLEQENINLRAQMEVMQHKEGQYCAQIELKEQMIRELNEKNQSLEKQNSDLMGMGDQAKYQHFNQIKQQKNQETLKLQTLQNDVAKIKQDLKRAE